MPLMSDEAIASSLEATLSCLAGDSDLWLFAYGSLGKVYQSLCNAGKPAKVAITAIMRKLIILANALIRDDRKWTETAP